MENASEAIYLGIYTMIFVIALSLTVFLFSSMLDYSEEAYEYMHSLGNDAVVINAPANKPDGFWVEIFQLRSWNRYNLYSILEAALRCHQFSA